VYDRILKQCRERISTSDYVMTLHAEEAMTDDGLNVYDVESCVLTGEIVARQKDRKTGEWKYQIRGEGLAGDPMEVAAKLSITQKLVIITVYGL